MNFLNNIAFIGLIAIPIIILFHIFKPKSTKTVISSVILWKNVVETNASENKLFKFKKNLLLILQILTVLFLILAISRPYIKYNDSPNSFVILLDCSMSMKAQDVSPSRFEAAKKDIRKFINKSGNESEYSLILLNDSPSIVVSKTKNKEDFFSKLENIQCSNTGIDYNKIDAIVKDILKTENTEIVLFSDNLYDIEGYEIHKKIIGNSAENSAVENISYNKLENIIYVTVKNYSSFQDNRILSLYADNKILFTEDIQVNPNSDIVVTFRDIPNDAVNIMASISESQNDILNEDDKKNFSINSNKDINVFYISQDNLFLQKAINSISNVNLSMGNLNDIGNKNFDLYVFDGILPENIPDNGNIILFNPPVGNSLIETMPDEEVNNIYFKRSNLFNYINNMQFDIGSSKRLAVPEWGTSIADSDNFPIIVYGTLNNQKILVFGFDIHKTDFPLKKEFPMLIYNIFDDMFFNTDFQNINSINVKDESNLFRNDEVFKNQIDYNKIIGEFDLTIIFILLLLALLIAEWWVYSYGS